MRFCVLKRLEIKSKLIKYTIRLIQQIQQILNYLIESTI